MTNNNPYPDELTDAFARSGELMAKVVEEYSDRLADAAEEAADLLADVIERNGISLNSREIALIVGEISARLVKRSIGHHTDDPPSKAPATIPGTKR